MAPTAQGPDPERLVRELADVVNDVVGAGVPDSRRRELLEWTSGLLQERPAAKLLAKLHRYGTDLPKLLLVGLRFRTSRADYERTLSKLSFGPARLADRATVPIDQLLRSIDGRSDAEEFDEFLPDLPPVEVLREYDRRLELRNERLRSEGSQPRKVWKPGPDGAFHEVEFTPDLDGAFAIFLRSNPVHETAPLPHRQKGAGHPTDVAESVLVVLVAGHLNAVHGKPHLNLAGRFVHDVLRIQAPGCGDYSNVARAFENRARRHWANDGMRARAKLLAKDFDLPVRFD